MPLRVKFERETNTYAGNCMCMFMYIYMFMYMFKYYS